MASSSQPAPPEQGSEDHLWDYLAVVLRHRKFALAIFLTATAVATIRRAHPARLHGDSTDPHRAEKSNVLNFKDVTEVDAAKDDYYQTQYRLRRADRRGA